MINKLKLFDVITNKKYMKVLQNNLSTMFLSIHSKILFRGFSNVRDVKYFHITDSTRKRLINVPIDSSIIKPMTQLEPDKGFVYFNDGLHFIYLVRKNSIIILTSKGIPKKISDNVLFAVGQTTSALAYFNLFDETSKFFINNPLDILDNDENLLINEPETKKVFAKIKKEKKENIYDTASNLSQDRDRKAKELELCIQAFMFIKFAKIIDVTRISEDGVKRSFAERRKGGKKNELDVIRIDTHYDQNMKVINPFSVSGHFREQPIGKDRKEYKTIYIDSFMKTGYHRKATKLKLNEKTKK